MPNLLAIRHEKETTYFIVSAIISGIVWLFLIWFAWIALIPAIIISWLTGQYFRAMIFGNTIKVSPEQFTEIYEMAEHATKRLNLTEMPEIFILSGQGAINALAIKFLTRRYVLLYSNLVDLALKRGAYKELQMIIGHELAHHALGHTNIFKNLFLIPANLIPFLGAAYGRARELSADRVGMVLTGDSDAAKRALASLALGSESLATDINLMAFKEQENYIPPIMGFLYEIYSSHPRMTKRITELENYAGHMVTQMQVSAPVPSVSPANLPYSGASLIAEPAREVASAQSDDSCPHCGRRYQPGDNFCYDCGQKLT